MTPMNAHFLQVHVLPGTGRTARRLAPGAGHPNPWGERMLSRTADHLFWMSRDTERADKRCALATQQRPPAQQARGFLPGEESC